MCPMRGCSTREEYRKKKSEKNQMACTITESKHDGIFVHPLGWGLLGAAAMYFATVWWMDRHGTWKR